MFKKIYDSSGMRLTTCCGACSTYIDSDQSGYCDVLVCKQCFCSVEFGEGDGNEYKENHYSN